MFLVRIAVGLAIGYAILVVLGWLFQERLAFPAPRAPVPDPKRLGIANGERIEVVTKDGTRLAGWYLSPALHRPAPPSPALLWFYGNGETIASLAPILRDFHPGRIYVYGRSLGSAVAIYTAAHHPVAGLIVESPFTSAADMARRHYALVPRLLLRLSLDNASTITQVRCPILLFHGTADRLVPTAMGMRVAAAAPGPVEVVLIQNAGHNDTYDVGGDQYREKVWAFVGAGK